MAAAGSRGARAASAPGGGVPPFKAAPRRGSAAAAAGGSEGGGGGRRAFPPARPGGALARARRPAPGLRAPQAKRPPGTSRRLRGRSGHAFPGGREGSGRLRRTSSKEHSGMICGPSKPSTLSPQGVRPRNSSVLCGATGCHVQSLQQSYLLLPFHMVISKRWKIWCCAACAAMSLLSEKGFKKSWGSTCWRQRGGASFTLQEAERGATPRASSPNPERSVNSLKPHPPASGRANGHPTSSLPVDSPPASKGELCNQPLPLKPTVCIQTETCTL
ncbi:uncharacterized protein LOC130844549 [Hippopotamus amphibius kiboko]|uniref:uncharacterized protein LOC130844549 n=1 Tax=Hippopotamus amphibius kiboko TaxID=575201 RepID=UPI002596DA04|nr:uncharacterized protein LOC130844549 [Hippopotamus amphibius kiboko]